MLISGLNFGTSYALAWILAVSFMGIGFFSWKMEIILLYITEVKTKWDNFCQNS